MRTVRSHSLKDEKLNNIISASQKRFGAFGVDKTSMKEIADDLKISKASLYYYFSDKESLYKAVLEKEQNEFISKISEEVSSISDPELLLIHYAELRITYFRTLWNLSRLRLEVYAGLKHNLSDLVAEFKTREKELIIKIFERGIQNGIFFIDDTEEITILFLDMLKGIRLSAVYEKQTLFIEDEDYDLLHKKTLEFTNLFIRGIKNEKTR